MSAETLLHPVTPEAATPRATRTKSRSPQPFFIIRLIINGASRGDKPALLLSRPGGARAGSSSRQASAAVQLRRAHEESGHRGASERLHRRDDQRKDAAAQHDQAHAHLVPTKGEAEVATAVAGVLLHE